MSNGDQRSLRVLVLAPTIADAQLTRSILARAELACDVCADVADVVAHFAAGAGAIAVTDEVLVTDNLRALADALRSQPPWSDIPVVLLAASGVDGSGPASAGDLGNVTVLERPVRITTLVSTLRSAIAARRRQYLLRDRLGELTRTEASLRNLTQRLRLLLRAAALLLSSEQPARTMGSLFAHIAPHFDLHAYVYMCADASEALRMVSCAGISQAAAESVRVDGAEDRLERLMRAHGMRAHAFFPLTTEGRLLGVLSFATRSRDQFDEQELGFLRTISHYVTIASERARLIDELRDTDRRKDEFLATLAHELRNPLAPIRNALHIMRLDPDAATLGQAHAMMDRQLGHMVRLIDDLLDVSRITRGKLELRRERVELAAIVNNAVDTSRPLIEAAGHELNVSLPDEPIVLDADPVRLAQVVANLLSNASKYMDRGGRICLTAQRRELELAISVRDTGIGIPAAALSSVFEMFMQVDHSVERSQGGLGIGLTLVKNLVEMHGGRVAAQSEGVGKGSEFTVQLPVAATAPQPDARRGGSTAATSGPRFRVLVADDNADAAESMGAMLRLMGHDVRTVRDGRQALDETARFRPDLALLDIGMPGMSGYEVARRVRREHWGRNVVLVALTGWGQEDDKRKAIDAGFDEHFTKPVDPEDIEALIARRTGHSVAVASHARTR